MKHTINVCLDKATVTKLDNFTMSKSRTIRTAIDVLWKNRLVVYRITCDVNERVFIGVEELTKFYRDSYLAELANGVEKVGYDVKQYGPMEFHVEVLGNFPTRSAALDYRDFIMNRCADLGEVLYNDELYNGEVPRFLSFKLTQDLFESLVKFCAAKGVKIDKVLNSLIKKIVP